ncbi:uncharacterized protein METZ01_LOCUS269259, partial [marine metagenome]
VTSLSIGSSEHCYSALCSTIQFNYFWYRGTYARQDDTLLP